jgi:hypothetical protein
MDYINVEPNIKSEGYSTYVYFFIGVIVFILIVVVFYYMTRKTPEPLPDKIFYQPNFQQFVPQPPMQKAAAPAPPPASTPEPEPMEPEQQDDKDVHHAQYPVEESPQSEDDNFFHFNADSTPNIEE